MGDKELGEKLMAEFGEELKNPDPATVKDVLAALETWETIRGMEITVEWLVDRIIPRESITLLFGKGGIGKTWLAMDMARAVGQGVPYLGLATVKTDVIFVDFENPLAVLNLRTQKLGDGNGVFFWRANNPILKAPKLDKKEWEQYRQLPPGALLIFDTLRASQDRDENKSDEMGMVMGRLKELRDMGFTIILLHHTAKNSDRVAKGSTAIVDLADHILGLTLVRKRRDGQEIVVEDEEGEEDLAYRFGVREKTRFEPYAVYLTLNPDHGFELAPDPQEDTLKRMEETLSRDGDMLKTAFLSICSREIGLPEKKIRRLFDIGQGRYWQLEKGLKNAYMVKRVQNGKMAPYIGAPNCQIKNPDWQTSENITRLKTAETLPFNELGKMAKDLCQFTKQTEVRFFKGDLRGGVI